MHGSRPRRQRSPLRSNRSRLAFASVLAMLCLMIGIRAGNGLPQDSGLRPQIALAASPSPSQAAGGDTRSVGEGPGLVGAPFIAIGGVVLLGIMTAAFTLLYVRVSTGGQADHTDRQRRRPR
jgi:hypothetical protein